MMKSDTVFASLAFSFLESVMNSLEDQRGGPGECGETYGVCCFNTHWFC